MSCTLSAVGRRFDVDAFLARTGFRPGTVWRRQESSARHAGRGARPVSGFIKTIGRSDFGPLKTQVRAAIRFLEAPRHQRMLAALRRTAGIDAAVLDFGIRWEDVAAQFDALPPRLVELAARYRLWLVVSHYPVDRRE